MNNSVLVDCHAFISAESVIFAVEGRGHLNKLKIPVQEFEDEIGEAAYF